MMFPTLDAPTSARAVPFVSPDRPRILVVDDEPQALRVFSAFLAAAGMEVLAVDSAARAIELLQTGRFETVVTDLRMPGVDGFDLLRFVRSRDTDLPVVVITGCPTLDTPSDALELGAIDFLVKPVSADLFVRTVTMSARLCRLARCARRAAPTASPVATPPQGPGVAAAFARALGTLYVAWQPIVRAGDGTDWGREAFVRTLEPSLSAPEALFAAADRLDRFRELGRLVRRSAAEDLPFPGTGPAFVNVHPSELDDEELLDPASPLSPRAESVVLELTDRTPLENVLSLRARVRALRELGYRIGLDNVGSGGSSLNRLALVEPDFVKLNPALSRGCDLDASKRQAIASVAGALHDLGIRVVATGIETVDEQEAAGETGVDFLQGFLFGRPRPVPAARRAGEARSAWTSSAAAGGTFS